MVEAQRKIAVLIDSDNASPSSIEKVLEKIKTLGELRICRAYGDWAAGNKSGWKDIERTCSVRLIQQSSYVAGKNATDMAMVIDAMSILHSGKVDTFCLVSSDSDFTPLAIRLRDEGCQVIGVGNKQTNEVFINACTKFIAVDSLTIARKAVVKLPKPAPVPVVKKVTKTVEGIKSTNTLKTPKAPSPISLLKEAYIAAPQKDGWVLLTQLGQSLHQLDAGFKPNKYGRSTLGKLIQDHPDLFEVKGSNAKVYVKLKS